MASVFTFEPNPPRVASPWSTSAAASPPGSADQAIPPFTKLEAEPQDGPTEYKLHLLLRPRRDFASLSTGPSVSGSFRINPEEGNGIAKPHKLSSSPSDPTSQTQSSGSRAVASQAAMSTAVRETHLALAHRNGPSTQLARYPSGPVVDRTRQHRLEQLTTQLLWRLQQSAPHHAAAPNSIILPTFPLDSAKLGAPSHVAELLPGLEESRGALYEIGVSDDGVLVGLAEDEMEESLNNLRAMAACLGCVVDVPRMLSVGVCEWVEDVEIAGEVKQKLQSGSLWVAEAFVRPPQVRSIEQTAPNPESRRVSHMQPVEAAEHDVESFEGRLDVDQLRVTFTGTTMSGKTSLLGSVTTGTLDNGRGKSRLSLLRHRHEVVTGMTSSVTQELLGFQFREARLNEPAIALLNYASDRVSSWTDIHALATKPFNPKSAAHSSRLVLLSDSAGHPRYRRTTVRGLIGWAPHWTLLCIPADGSEDTSGKSGSTPPPEDLLGSAAADVDLSQAHMNLCLSLKLPFVVVITKLDLASRAGLRATLAKVFSSLKSAGRSPQVLYDKPADASADFSIVSASGYVEAKSVVEKIEQSAFNIVPIILTSAVNGSGLNRLLALLSALPICKPLNPPLSSAQMLRTDSNTRLGSLRSFHIEDVYTNSSENDSGSIVLAGYLQQGRISLGDKLFVGPFTVDNVDDDSLSTTRSTYKPASRSYPGALPRSSVLASKSGFKNEEEWHTVRVTSIRNLRRPVRSLLVDQVGTVAVVQDRQSQTPVIPRVRKGMVLASPKPRSTKTFTIQLTAPNIPKINIGSAVVVYIASVRAAARVIALLKKPVEAATGGAISSPEVDGSFAFDFEDDEAVSEVLDQAGLMTLDFISSREFVEVGSRALVMPGGPGLHGGERGEKGVAGLEGYVGVVVDVSG